MTRPRPLVIAAVLLVTAFAAGPGELDRGRREAILHRIQQLMHDKAMFAPIFELASLGGYGSRVAESGPGLIPSMAASAPYEDLRLRGKRCLCCRRAVVLRRRRSAAWQSRLCSSAVPATACSRSAWNVARRVEVFTVTPSS